MLTDEGEVTKEVQESIMKATRQGVQVILCTGECIEVLNVWLFVLKTGCLL